jgi:fatty acid desaturase
MPTRASDLLSRDEIRAFTRTSNVRGALAVGGTWAVIAGTLVAAMRWPHPAVLVAAVIVIGGRQLALAIAMHEAAHGHLFRTSWLNTYVADLLCARPIGQDIARYRAHHLSHHAHAGTDRDPDLALAPLEPIPRGSLVRKMLRDVTGIAGLRRLIGLVLIDANMITYTVGGATRRQRHRTSYYVTSLLRHAPPTIVINAVMFLVLGWAYALWAIAWLTTYGLFLRIRMLAEHSCLLRGPDVLLNTRTTHAGWLARTTVAPLRVNYHLEHHLMPSTPWYQLPALHRMLRERSALPEQSTARGYFSVLSIVTR